MGASEPLCPSSWQGCKKCPRDACTHGRSIARGQHDVIYVQQETLWNGVQTETLKSTVRRVHWSSKIDHSLVTLMLPVFGESRCLPSAVRIRNNAEKFYVPGELLPRAARLARISSKHDDVLRSGVTDSVVGAWAAVKNTLQEEPLSLPVTAEAMSAAKINAPQNYWNRLAGLKCDNGAPTAISSECMLRCVRHRGVITVDPRKTGDVVLDHRKEMAQVPVVLPMSESRVYEALHDVSRYNSTVVGLSGDSAAAKTALQPDCFWSVN